MDQRSSVATHADSSQPPTAVPALKLDPHTRNDLQLFTADPDAPSLFKFCNRCRTEGGMKVLRRRMDAPWAAPKQIQATQNAVRFVLAHNAAIGALPSAHLINSTQRYLREILPVVRGLQPLEFFPGAFALWSQEQRFFGRITRGAAVTGRLLDAVEHFLERLGDVLTPDVDAGDLVELCTELARCRERLATAAPPLDGHRWFWRTLKADQVFRLTQHSDLERLLALLYEIDALVSMAEVSSQPGFTVPTLLTGPTRVEATQLKHPLLENAVANPLSLDDAQPVLLLTGPNMAGKTTYLRAVATALYLAQLGMAVPAATFAFTPVQRLLTSISLNDDLLDGISYFRAEALRVKAVAEAIAAGESLVAIMDEPFKGTNVKDAFDASLAILNRFAATQASLFLVSSHLVELADPLSQGGRIVFRYFEANEAGARLGFDYQLREGISDQRLGMRVLEEEGIFALLDGKMST